jgi:hypothetical protein
MLGQALDRALFQTMRVITSSQEGKLSSNPALPTSQCGLAYLSMGPLKIINFPRFSGPTS